ncbi:AAA family ATPase [Campylobacter canadensis]|uniref:AAA domain-containing protein n=1 Tax=Campylobacter canadensis TaxID=449520 RepID=UPI001553DF31|nr:AAA domain-containing protein [Campylobacter canadensis]MBZ7995422.1 AAA family ATPase [Campylobacter canadensis]MBZ7997030.1 AAA family ATPase [Campylobacter canadensis]MBZ8000601.1 AAA family ATPase [Campylobacter canadensis]MBZ8002313.1 AAA family ATPase [Campylobacter canadensis]MBZ8003444.1 AAA family ATPase [Campylobacter canadensis]
MLDKIYKNGLFKDNIEFLLEVNNKNNNFDCKSIDELLKEIKQHSSSDDNAILYSEKSIKMEEDLLKAENDYIQSKKLSQIGTISNTKNNQLCFVIENANRHFKQNHKVIIKKLNYTQDDDELKGVVDKFVSTKSLLYVNIEDEYSKINLKQYDKNEILIKYSINYDYQAEEIVFKKKERALDELKKSNVYINNLASKLCEPNLNFTENNLIKIDEFFNKNLDENQQLAVKKALSLQDGSEILLIQGPPGTGKTTTIVEIIKQYLKLHPSYKMLITSQSNQAVDNVLEKICEEEQKILRIGNDESKMSEIARKYTPNKIINTIVSKNIKDLQENEIQEFKKNQDEFKEILQSITSKSVKNTDVEMFFIKNIKIIFGTLIGISSWNNFREIVFDLVIVDEAGRATLSELLVPCIKAKKIIFVGDHKQLAPIIDDDIANNLESYSKKEVITSLFEQLFNSNTKFNNLKHMLTYNYRAHKSICNIYSNVFYEGDLKTKDEINELKQHNIDCYIANLVWLNTGNLKDRADEQKGTGKINRCNAKIIKQELNTLQNYCKNNNLSIGIITPYKDQKYYLDNYLKDIVQKYKQDDIQIDIGTVDSFQGSDRDIIFYDCVRAGGGKKSKIDFIADEKRLNVSLSRAKKLLLIVGDIDFLYKSCTNNGFNPFKEIIEYIYKNKSEYEVRNLGEINEA